ncbi:MAG: HAD family hydrolase [Coriobacteriaceae bacterium]|jgi:phosphoglycolate phosphatase|nr:HAD-IA family hydrolase [Olsenella sp.]MCI1289906.1 HAD-IA family hydrolase [Olsenella sp.]RRF89423.1 MAG: HAD family hydrolase [Coriobacteriaceae bacterium]
MTYKAAIFDLDGTLLNTIEDLHTSINYALHTNGFPEQTLEQTTSNVGNGVRQLVHRSLPMGTPTDQEEQVFSTFSAHYGRNYCEKTVPYPRVMEMLHAISAAGMLRAVVSNKPDAAVQKLVAIYFPGLFNAVVGEREDIRRKPAPDTVDAVMEALGVTPDECVYVGDSEVDVDTARNAKTDCICVSWGYRGKAALKDAGAKVIVDDADQLADVLLGE